MCIAGGGCLGSDADMSSPYHALSCTESSRCCDGYGCGADEQFRLDSGFGQCVPCDKADGFGRRYVFTVDATCSGDGGSPSTHFSNRRDRRLDLHQPFPHPPALVTRTFIETHVQELCGTLELCGQS